MRHVMIDFETLGKGPNAVVLSLGAVRFDEGKLDDIDVFHHCLNVQQQIDEGRDIDASTVAWWFGQSDEARRPFTESGRVQLAIGTVLSAFTEFFKAKESLFLWSHGANFDVPILESLYTSRSRETPWKYSDVRDTRTLFSLLKPQDHDTMRSLLKPAGVTAHHALVDSLQQALAVQYSLMCIKEAIDAKGR